MKHRLLFLLFSFISFPAFAQDNNATPWYISANLGEQHSGIRKEDYVASNFSPLVIIECGKFITHGIALRAGMKGFYYNFISDDDKHYYGYLFGGIVVDIHKLVSYRKDWFWNTQLYLGGGAFYNRYPYLRAYVGKMEYPNGRLMTACDMGFSNLFRISPQLQLGIDVCGIASWGLYQDSVDIIPSASIKAVYTFK